MKNILKILAGIILFFGCSEEYLDRAPLSEVSLDTYFKKATDFELYVNQFYTSLSNIKNFGLNHYEEDGGTDNMIGIQLFPHFNGETTVEAEDGAWNNAYGTIRRLNIMIKNGPENFEGDMKDINPYLGEARFFRAKVYFQLLRRYGGVPYIDEPLLPSDEMLYKKRLSRDQLAVKIIEDLDFAISHVPPFNGNGVRLSREAVAAFKSRVCLFEGTWEKYHALEDTPFQVEGSDGTKFLEEALSAAELVINSEKFSLYNETDEPYYNLFNRQDLSTNPEVILFNNIVPGLPPNQNISARTYIARSADYAHVGMTDNAIKAYIDIEGNPISISSLELINDSVPGVVINRDPRLRQTLYLPGELVYDTEEGNSLFYGQLPLLRQVPTGYHFKKGGSRVGANHLTSGEDGTDYIVFRYGEVLLNYIEAKAELDEVTQVDLDMTVNALRKRGGLSENALLKLGNIPVDNDNVWVKNGLAPLIAEIRRERRIELMVEGFRKDDIIRWAGADEIIEGETFYGADFSWWVEKEPSRYQPGSLPVNSEGLLDPWRGAKYDFVLNRDYLYPLPGAQVDLVGYEQNPNWD